MDILLSVIVPVYNVEHYLPRCLDSLLRQGGEYIGGYEVICVNDGSPDGCADILNQYSSQYPGIVKVITQENRGLGPARNAGVAAAKGEYVAFVDSDDYVIDGGYRYICEHFLEGRPDVIHFQYHHVMSDGKMVDSDAKPDGEILFDGDGAEVYTQSPFIQVWENFYKRDFLIRHDIWMENVMAEDLLFNFSVFQKSPRLRIVSSDIYRYEWGNGTSIMNTSKKEKVISQLDELLFRNIGAMERFLEKGDARFFPAVRLLIRSLQNTGYKKWLCTLLSRKEWQKYSRRFKALPIYRIPCYGRLEKIAMFLNEQAIRSYLMHCFVVFLRKYVYYRFLRKRVIERFLKQGG